jgi:hypothetical protein
MQRYLYQPKSEFGGIHLSEAVIIQENIKKLQTLGYGIKITSQHIEAIENYLTPIVNRDNKIGFMNCFGEVVIEPIFSDTVLNFTNFDSIIIVNHNGKFGAINCNNDIVVPFQYSKYSYLDRRYLAFMDDTFTWGLFDLNGSLLVPFGLYDQIFGVNSIGLILASKLRSRGALDLNGNIIIPFNFDWMDYDFYDGLARVIIYVNSEKRWGIINLKGEYVVDPIYDNIWSFSTKYRSVKAIKNNLSTEIDLSTIRKALNDNV